MKPQVSIILLILILPFTNIDAQFTTFDLSKYKTSDYERRILTFSGNISGNYKEDKGTYFRYDKAFNSNLNLDYDYIKNTRKIQRDFQFGFSLNPLVSNFNSNNSRNTEYSKYDNSSNLGEISINSTNRFYFTEKRFFEIDVFSNLEAQYSKTEAHSNYYNATENESQKRFAGNILIPVKLGFGRLENVEDARLAIFILEDMQKNQQLLKEITDEDILLFSEKITQLKNKRHFDQRKRRIYEIQALDSLLRENAFTSSQNAVYFSSLMDNWGYANNPWRKAGKRFSFGVAPNLSYFSFNSSTKQKSNYKGVDLFAEIYYSKPLSLKWQKDIQLKGGYMKNDDQHHYEFNIANLQDMDRETLNDIIYLSGSWGYGFYPNTRSYLNLSLFSNVEKNWAAWSPADPGYQKGYLEYKFDLRLDGYIYFSERLSLNYNLMAGYHERNAKTEDTTAKFHNFGTSFNVSFSYSIF